MEEIGLDIERVFGQELYTTHEVGRVLGEGGSPSAATFGDHSTRKAGRAPGGKESNINKGPFYTMG